MKKRFGKKREPFSADIINIFRCRSKEQIRDAIRLLKAAGIRAETDPSALGKKYGKIMSKDAFSLWVKEKGTVPAGGDRLRGSPLQVIFSKGRSRQFSPLRQDVGSSRG